MLTVPDVKFQFKNTVFGVDLPDPGLSEIHSFDVEATAGVVPSLGRRRFSEA
jgi:hypothetical protein